ncbi:MAG: hypothetical protein KBT09_10320, partial [Bacteroidales bacterium]|nr:hypothetical protein [Candidatus Sodaliphilus fimicaballi]
MKKFILFVLSLMVTASALAVNKLTFTDVSFDAGATEQTVYVDMLNQDGVSGVQFKMTLPQGVTVKTGRSGPLVSKNDYRFEEKDHTAKCSLDGGVYTVTVSSPSNDEIWDNDGRILSFVLVAEGDVYGSYIVNVTDIIIITTAGEEVQDENSTSFTVKGAQSTLSFSDVEIVPGGTATVTVNMENQPDIAGFSFNMLLPEGLSVVTDDKDKMIFTLNEDRVEDHIVEGNIRSTGETTVISYSGSTAAFKGRNGQILTFQLKADPSFGGVQTVDVKDITFATTAGKKIKGETWTTFKVTGPEIVNKVTFDQESVNIEAGGTATVNVNLANQADVVRFSFDLMLPEGLSIVTGEDNKPFVMNESRLSGHVLTVNKQSEYLYGLSVNGTASFVGLEGNILSFQIKADDSYCGNHNIELADIVMRTDNNLRVQDESSASMTVVGPKAKNLLTFDQSYINIEPGKIATVDMNLENQPEVTNVSFKMVLPEGLSIVTDDAGKMQFDLNSARSNNHTLDASVSDVVTVRVSGYSPFKGTNGNLLSFQVKADDSYTGSNAIYVYDIVIRVIGESSVQDVQDEEYASIDIIGPDAALDLKDVLAHSDDYDGHVVTIADKLIAVVAKDETKSDDVQYVIWAKDEKDSYLKFVERNDKEDFVGHGWHNVVDAIGDKVDNYLWDDWEEHNWIKINLTSVPNIDITKPFYIKAGSLTGVYSGKANGFHEITVSSLEADGTPTAEECKGNLYCMPNFNDANYTKNISYFDGKENHSYYLINPKPEEVCTVIGAQWDGEKFVRYEVNKEITGLLGEFTVDWRYNVKHSDSDVKTIVDKLNSNKDVYVNDKPVTYKFKAVVTKRTKASNAPAKVAMKDTAVPVNDFVLYPLDFDVEKGDHIITAVENVNATMAVKRVSYYNVAGCVFSEAQPGINIVVTEYSDGSHSTAK